MNSEELEQSLRTEFESYLKNVLTEMRQEVSDFQNRFEAEFTKHKTQLDELFQEFSARMATEKQLDAGFTESVVEHLRLSRDEGARITATAIAEAEEMEKEKAAAAPPRPGIGEILNAVNDISAKTTQSTILKSLVNQAEQFTPRGAFFIIKNEHLVGWRAFGKEGRVDEQIVREVIFPAASETVLGEAVRSLAAVESSFGTYADEAVYLERLGFGEPARMYAIPLVVRGRAVAVLYADYGNEGGEVNLEALETLVRVASLTVEVLASNRGAHPHAESASVAVPPAEAPEAAPVEETAAQESEAPVEETAAAPVAEAAPEVASDEVGEPAYAYEYASEPAAVEEAPAAFEETPAAVAEETPAFEKPSESFADAGGQTMIESDGFAFTPSVSGSEPTAYSYDEAAIHVSSEADASEAYEINADEVETVEAAQETQAWSQPAETADYYAQPSPAEPDAPAYQAETEAASFAPATPENEYAATPANEYQFETTAGYEASAPEQTYEATPVEFEETPASSYEAPAYEAPAYETPAYETPSFETQRPYEAPSSFESTPSYETPSSFETPQYQTAESYSSGAGQSYGAYQNEPAATESYAPPVAVETPGEPAAQPAGRSRFSERNVDLPIEVPEEERRWHNDARRFARLLVSEIKLYNEQKVREGREASDLYDRLKEAIDRSREMYDKRVQPPVVAKFDYFHYELVNNLAEGDANKLGGSYPGGQV